MRGLVPLLEFNHNESRCLLFITAQVTTVAETVTAKQAGKLVPFGVVIGFIAGLTLDAVFRKLITSDIVELSAVEAKKRS